MRGLLLISIGVALLITTFLVILHEAYLMRFCDEQRYVRNNSFIFWMLVLLHCSIDDVHGLVSDAQDCGVEWSLGLAAVCAVTCTVWICCIFR